LERRQVQGREIKTIGDSFMAAFKCAGAVNFATRVVGAVKDAEIWLSDRAKEDIDRLRAGKHRGLKWEQHEGVAMKGFPGKFTHWALK
jgi:class 3 adenylate cyclase